MKQRRNLLEEHTGNMHDIRQQNRDINKVLREDISNFSSNCITKSLRRKQNYEDPSK